MVSSTRVVLLFAGAVALVQCAVAVPTAQEHFRDSITVSASTTRPGLGGYALTFSAPVALPGVALARGTYIFRSPAAHIVQVSSIDGSDPLMFATVPTSRPTPTARYSIVLGAADAGAPRRILALFAPGEITGEQFVYQDR